MNIIRTVATATVGVSLIAGLTACDAITSEPTTYTRPMAVWIYIPPQANVPEMGMQVMVGVRVIYDGDTVVEAA